MRFLVLLVASLTAPVWASAVAAAPQPLSRDPFALPLAAPEGSPQLDPLQRHPLAELTLVGTVHGVDPPRALIEDPEGLGFVVVAGNIIGVERAQITGIDPGVVVAMPPTSPAHRVVLSINRASDAFSELR